MNFKFDVDQDYPEGDWVTWKAYTELSGSHFVLDEVKAFCLAAESAPGGTVSTLGAIERTPDNPYDANALVAYGVVGGKRYRLGHISRGVAAELAEYPKTMPLTLSVRYIRFVGDSAYVTVLIHTPSKPTRRANGWLRPSELPSP